MFRGCSSLSDIKSIEKWDVSENTNFDSLFWDCSSLLDIKPLQKWDVSQCTNFYSMFRGCSLLSDIKQLEKWMYHNVITLFFCSMVVHHYLI